MQPEQAPNSTQPSVQQPVFSAAPAASAPAGTYSDYISNPFLNSVRGLVLMLKTNPVAIMLSGLVALLALIAIFIVQFILTFATRSAGAGAGGGAIVAIIGILAFLTLGVVLFGSYNVIAGRSAREETVSVKESYAIAFKRFFGALLLTIIFGALYLLTSILLILPGIYFAARASLSFFVFYEENLSAVGALKRSFELTKGHVIEMLGAVVASALLGGGSGLLSGAISLSPLVGRYHDLKNLKESGAPKPKVHYLNWLTVVVVLVFVVGYIALIAFTVASGVQSQSSSSSFDASSNPYSSSFSN